MNKTFTILQKVKSTHISIEEQKAILCMCSKQWFLNLNTHMILIPYSAFLTRSKMI